MDKLVTRASSINRALDQIGDKWCLLIIQEVFWGIHSFNEMMTTIGMSRGVLSGRLKWLESVDCLQRGGDGPRKRYYLTDKSLALYDCALMAMRWERQFYRTPALDAVTLSHKVCGKAFTPEIRCGSCNDEVRVWDTAYAPGPGATEDLRDKKVRRRSSIPVANIPSQRSLYRNMVNILGDRWTANIIALSFHGLKRFDAFHRELPIATNILSDRLRLLVTQGIFEQREYQEKPQRLEYHLTEKGEATFPYFLALLQWGDNWCDPEGRGQPMQLSHLLCGEELHGQVRCSACQEILRARDVEFSFGEP